MSNSPHTPPRTHTPTSPIPQQLQPPPPPRRADPRDGDVDLVLVLELHEAVERLLQHEGGRGAREHRAGRGNGPRELRDGPLGGRGERLPASGHGGRGGHTLGVI